MSDETEIHFAAPSWRGYGPPAAAGAAPWLWFLVRDTTSWADLAAAMLPVAVAGLALAWALVAALRREPRWLVASAITILMGLTAVLLPLRPEGGGPPDPQAGLRIAAANVADLDDHGIRQARELAVAGFDVVVVSEMTWNLQRTLQERFPHVAVLERRSDLAPWGTVAPSIGIFSRAPLSAVKRPRDLPGLRVRVDGPGGPFVLYGLHVPRPHPYDREGGVSPAVHREVIDDTLERIRGERLPVVVAGDLNATDRGGGYRAFRGLLDDAMRSEWAGGTSRLDVPLWSALVLRIDHILRPRTWCSAAPERFRITASDHLGVAADVGPCP